jgi:hypothetical protein
VPVYDLARPAPKFRRSSGFPQQTVNIGKDLRHLCKMLVSDGQAAHLSLTLRARSSAVNRHYINPKRERGGLLGARPPRSRFRLVLPIFAL